MLLKQGFDEFSQKYGSAWKMVLRALKTTHEKLYRHAAKSSEAWECTKFCAKKLWIAAIINPKLRKDSAFALAFIMESIKRFKEKKIKYCPSFEKLLKECDDLPPETIERILEALRKSSLGEFNISGRDWLLHLQQFCANIEEKP